ncbi:uncharacterized protein LOC134836995 [Culicoides brevitarsis]|uniref:uncharacterized protein LOC134836995 n=1 Tax=Culicoides brevitarsis TaxID=469753 RepID=UPI00307C0342
MSSRKSILRSSHGIPRPLSARSTKSNEISADKVLKRKIPETRAVKKLPDDILDLSDVDLSLMSRKNSDFSEDQVEAIVDEQQNETKMYFSTPIKTNPAVENKTCDEISSPVVQDTPKILFTPDSTLGKTSETEKTVINREVVGDVAESHVVSRLSDEKAVLLLPSFSFLALVALNILVLLYFYDRIMALEHEIEHLRSAVFAKNAVLKKENTNLIVYSEDSFWEMMISALFKIYDAMIGALTSFK